MDWNLSLFYLIYSLAFKYSWLDLLIVFFGEYYLYLLLAILAAILCLAYVERNKTGIKIIILAVVSGLVARFVVGEAIRYLYPHARPFLALHIPHLLTDYASSFPSGHIIFIFALATTLFLYSRKLSYFFFFSGLLVGLARIAGGVHYPADILGGIVLGILIGLLFNFIWHTYGDKKRKYN